MTKEFDTLLESMLAEMMPASMMDDFGPGEMTRAVATKLHELPGKSQHWGPLQKLSPEDRQKIIRAIINNVFTERDNTYTPMADDKNQLKELIKSAIVQTAKDHPVFKEGGKWAVQFLADRLSNEELLGKVKYTTETGKELKQDVTQKEFKAALNKALEDAPAAPSTWKKSSDVEEAPREKASKEEAPEQKDVDMVYAKAADLNSDDPDLQKAFSKLPDNEEMSWEAVIKKIGTSKALALMDVGGLTETAKEREVGEEEDVPALEIDDEDGPELSNFDKLINPYFDRSSNPFRGSSGDY
jgi:hypothetical protein